MAHEKEKSPFEELDELVELLFPPTRSSNRDRRELLKEVRKQTKSLERMAHGVQSIARSLKHLAEQHEQNTSLELEIPNQQGEITMGQPVSLTLGNPAVQAVVQELRAGTVEPDSGPIAFTSDNTAVATVDPVSGLVTPVSVGTANITATDSTNVPTLTDTVAVTVVAAAPAENDTLTLTIPTN